jgi:signal transduction histidine kinase/ligand-binding sensor domain-containing protein/DNA-binding response OmpR family regulator
MQALGDPRRVFLSVLGALVVCCSVYAGEGSISAPGFHRNGVVRLPVIDKHDIRFIPFTAAGDSMQSRIWSSVAQDNYGFMWFGTQEGLYRYDGYNLKRYRNPRDSSDSLSSDSITTILKDRTGILWVGTNHGLYRLDPALDTLGHYQHEPGDSRSLSADEVTASYEDRSGALWFGTWEGLDRLNPASGTFVHYIHNPQDAGSLSNARVQSIREDRRGNLWVGTEGGLNKLDRTTGRFSRFLHDSKNPDSLPQDFVNRILEDRSGVLWIASPFGSEISVLDVDTGKFTRYPFRAEDGSHSVECTGIFEDSDGALWVGTTDGGLLKLDRDRKRFLRYTREDDDPNSVPHDAAHIAFEDAEGVMWAETPVGLSRFRTKPAPFVDYKHQAGKPNTLLDNVVWATQEDSKGFLWIATQDGLQRLDRKTGQFTFYRHDSKKANSLSYNKVSAIREDRSGSLWFGTYGGGLDRFHPSTGQFLAYRHNDRDPGSLSGDLVLSLLMDRQGVMWVGTQDHGLNRFDARTGRFTSYRDAPPSIAVILEDHAGMLWLGGSDSRLYRFDPKTEKFAAYRYDSQNHSTTSGNLINAIWEDRQGTLWIGAKNGLVHFDRSRQTFTTFTAKDGLPSDIITGILEDSRENLWLATHQGLSQFDPRTKTFRNYSESDGLSGNYLNPRGAESTVETRAGEMIIGSSTGLTTFYPDRLADNPYIPPVVLTDFLLFNAPVQPGAKSPLRKPIWAADSLTLTDKQSIFTLEFASLSYADPEKNRYRYRLVGLEKTWNEVDSRRRSATYTSLPPGNYVFQVQGSNNDGIWNPKITTLAIAILPPWWATRLFIGIFSIMIAALVVAAYRSRIRGLQLASIRLETQVAERTRELETARDAAERASQAKSTFLATMSHELRTPLNSILGFSALVRDDPGLSEKHRKDLDIVNRSGEHLLELIDEVLDTAKIEAGRISLDRAPFDLSDLMRDIIELMSARASEKGLELFLTSTLAVPRFVSTDAGKLRQVLVNLIGNAIKYTERGSVTVRLDAIEMDNQQRVPLIIEVGDTGIGIAPEDQARIFDVFVQAGKASTRKGTGLGLSITRQFAQMMGGKISVRSTPGEGSLFRVELPVEEAEESEVLAAHDDPNDDKRQVVGLAPGQPEYRVLIVEDEKQNWLLLQRLLIDAGFHVRVAEDGAQGVDVFRTWQPHLIWMDLRLPVMGGLEAARAIRALDGGRDVRIVALTASAFAQQREEVLAAGLDDFLRKPYRPGELFDCMARHLGARYLYREISRISPADPVAPLRPEALAMLPQQLREELADAVVRLHPGSIAAAIDRVSEKDAQLGAILANCASRLAYTEIFNALEQSNTPGRTEAHV